MTPEREYTVAEALKIAGRDEGRGKVAVLVICSRVEPFLTIGSVREDRRFGFILRTGRTRGPKKTLTAIIGSNPTSRYRYPCARCGAHAPDPSELAAKIQAFEMSGERQKWFLS